MCTKRKKKKNQKDDFLTFNLKIITEFYKLCQNYLAIKLEHYNILIKVLCINWHNQC